MRMWMTGALALGLSALALTACDQQPSGTDFSKPAGKEWPLSGGDWNNSRFSSLKQINTEDSGLSKLTKRYTSAGAKKLLDSPLDRVQLAAKPLPYEKLDQLTMEVLLGVR